MQRKANFKINQRKIKSRKIPLCRGYPIREKSSLVNSQRISKAMVKNKRISKILKEQTLRQDWNSKRKKRSL